MKPIVTLTRKLPHAIQERMASLYDLITNDSDEPLARYRLIQLFQISDVIVPTIGDVIDASLIAHADPRLSLIANLGVGVDHIDVRTAMMRRITVTNTPNVFTDDVADCVIAMLLMMPRKILKGISLVSQRQWHGWSPTGFSGSSVTGKTLGIIGLGHIGQAVALRARALGLKIIYHNRRQLPEAREIELGVTYCTSLDQLLVKSDFISIHCPSTPATYHLLSSRRLELIRPDSYLINTSRGEIIDEDALLRKVLNRKIAGVALDVYQHEPDVDPLWHTVDNAILLPHLASATTQGLHAAGQRLILNIQTHLSGHAAPDRIPLSMI